jgi:hypothetical protein
MFTSPLDQIGHAQRCRGAMPPDIAQKGEREWTSGAGRDPAIVEMSTMPNSSP